MKRLVLTACAGMVIVLSLPSAEANAATNWPFGFFQSRQERKEARQERREERRARHRAAGFEAYKGAGSKQDNARINRENYRQRKEMERASKRENRKKWGSNEGGDVFGVYR